MRGLKQLLALRSTLCGTGLPLCEATAYGQALPSLAQALVQLRGVKKQANEVGPGRQAELAVWRQQAAAAAEWFGLGCWGSYWAWRASPAPAHCC